MMSALPRFALHKRVYFTVVCVHLSLTGCGHQSFRYTSSDPVRYEPIQDSDELAVFYGNGYGFIWSDCREVNSEAVDDLLASARQSGFDAVADIKWYDHVSGNWVKEPQCRTEYGWATGTIYTFWWPKATKVKVSAKGITKPLVEEKAAFFKTKSIGQNDLSSAEARSSNPHDKFISAELMAHFMIGLGLSAGKYTGADTRWALNAEMTMPFGDPHGCDTYSAGWGTLSFRREKFLGNSLYYGIGPAVQNQRYFRRCEQLELESGVRRTDASRRWEYGLVGADLGLGNEWRSASGLFIGCEWIGIFVGSRVWKRGDEVNEGKRIPRTVKPRLLACRAGVAF